MTQAGPEEISSGPVFGVYSAEFEASKLEAVKMRFQGVVMPKIGARSGAGPGDQEPWHG